MVLIVVEGFAHRLLQNNVMESSEIILPDHGEMPRISNDWQQRTPEAVGLTGAEYDNIQRTLNRLALAFTADRTQPPHPVVKTAEVPETMGVR